LERITVEITKEGTVTVSTSGFKGNACRDVTRAMEEALGRIKSDENTPEFYEESDIQHIHQS